MCPQPTSPNMKEANWAVMQPLLTIFKDQLAANPEFAGKLLDHGCDHFARTAPNCPKIHEYGLIGTEHFSLKICVVDCQGFHAMYSAQ